jgi:hypothetical protein
MAQTLDEIRRKGLEVLRRELGRTGLIRFLQQFETGRGDYAHERRQWVDELSLEELRALSRHARPGKGKKATRKR